MSSLNLSEAFDMIGLVPSLRYTLQMISKARRDTVFHLQRDHGGKYVHHRSAMEYTIAAVNSAADLIRRTSENGGLEFYLNREAYESKWNPHAPALRDRYLPIPNWESLWQGVRAELNKEIPRDAMFWYKFKYSEFKNDRKAALQNAKAEVDSAHKELDKMVERDQWWAARWVQRLKVESENEQNAKKQLEDQQRVIETRWEQAMQKEFQIKEATIQQLEEQWKKKLELCEKKWEEDSRKERLQLEKIAKQHHEHQLRQEEDKLICEQGKCTSAIKTQQEAADHFIAADLFWKKAWQSREQEIAEEGAKSAKRKFQEGDEECTKSVKRIHF